MKFINISFFILAFCSCGSSSSKREHNVFEQMPQIKQSESGIINGARTVVAYTIGKEPSDLNIVVGEAVWPYKGKIKEGYFLREEFENIITNKTSIIKCLCTPEYILVLVLRDQWESNSGALAFSENHNCMCIFDKDGKIVSSYRFQLAVDNNENPVTFSAANTINIIKESDRLIR